MAKLDRLIHISVKTTYLTAKSDPLAHNFVWSYEIMLSNDSDSIVQLLNRHWHIVDMTGKIEEVDGPGVIGLQPIIKPHKHFTYTSFCQLTTPYGTMEGHYEMQTLDEELFKVAIPKFVLAVPDDISQDLKSKLH